MITVTACLPEDCHHVVALGREVWGEWASGLPLPRQAIDMGHPVFIARDPASGKLVGYIVGMAEAFGPSALVFSIVVGPDNRRNGAGRALVRRLLQAFAEKRATPICANIDKTNAASQALFKSLGFVQTCEMPGYYEKGETMCRFELEDRA
jgi:L-amino acid N-acyltransferase YncA